MQNKTYFKTPEVVRRVLHSARPRICDDVALWCRTNGLSVIELHQPIHAEIVPLVRDDAVSGSEIEKHLPDLKRPQSLVVLPRARVRDEIGFVFLPDGAVLYQGNWFRPYLTDHPGYQARFRSRRSVKGDIFSLLGLWSDSFYHWFHDTLPRLWNSLPHLPPQTRFLIHSKPFPYQLESLAALGISQERLEYQQPRGDTVIERLWFATPLGHSSFTAGDTLKEIAGAFKKQFGCETRSPSRRLYISRRKARARAVLNESKLEPLLRKYHFEIVVMEGMSFQKQVEMCASAGVLIGPHGAGLTNLLYCPPGSRIGEIGFTGVFPHYLTMTRQLGHSFFRLIVDKAGEALIINADEFESWLETNFPV